MPAKPEDFLDRSLAADGTRFRWMLDGHGYFLEEEGLCSMEADQEEQDDARRRIDERMTRDFATAPAPDSIQLEELLKTCREDPAKALKNCRTTEDVLLTDVLLAGLRATSPDPGPDCDPLDPWEHRSERMRCRTCMWFAPKGDGEIGRCRRHAPTVSGYPVVFTSDWCGDHRLDEASS